VWFSDPKEEYVCEETGEEVVLMKDKSGRVIGFEKLNYSLSEAEKLHVAFETVCIMFKLTDYIPKAELETFCRRNHIIKLYLFAAKGAKLEILMQSSAAICAP
jgi:hypothetical protein